MNTAPSITADEIATFSEEGVVCLRSVIDPDWIDRLRRGLERHLCHVTDRGRIWHRDAGGRTTFYDSQAWPVVPEYREFVFGSPTAEIAGRLMDASRVNFFFDAVFVRAPGTRFRTPFHQDEPFWTVEGFQTCSVWMPLVPVERASSLEVVRGSHRWTGRFRQVNFGELTGDARDQVIFDEDAGDTVAFPDIEGQPERYDLVSWDMEPGDLLVLNGRSIHGGSGNLPPGRELRVFSTKWLGDDVRVRFRSRGMDPDHTEVMQSVGLADGDPIGTELYPLAWLAGNRSPDQLAGLPERSAVADDGDGARRVRQEKRRDRTE